MVKDKPLLNVLRNDGKDSTTVEVGAGGGIEPDERVPDLLDKPMVVRAKNALC